MGSGVLSCSSSLINNGIGFPFIASYRVTVNPGELFGKISDEGCKVLRFNPYSIARIFKAGRRYELTITVVRIVCPGLLIHEIISVAGLSDGKEVLSFFVVERDRDIVHCTFIEVWIC